MSRLKLIAALAAALFLGACSPPLSKLPVLGHWRIERCVYSNLPKAFKDEAMQGLGKAFEIQVGSIDLNAIALGQHVFFTRYKVRPATEAERRGLGFSFEAARQGSLQAFSLKDQDRDLMILFYLPETGALIFSLDGAQYLARRIPRKLRTTPLFGPFVPPLSPFEVKPLGARIVQFLTGAYERR